MKLRNATAIVAILPLFMAAGPVNASDLNETGDPHVDERIQQDRWSGLYIGGGVQAGSTTHDTTKTHYWDGDEGEEACAPACPGGTGRPRQRSGGGEASAVPWFTGSIDGIGAEGVGLSGTAGYDFRFPGTRWVIGILGNYVYSDDYWETEFSALYTHSAPVFGPDAALSGELSKENEWTLGGRVGALVGPRTMIYAMAGYTQADFAGNVDFADDTPSMSFGDVTFDGYTAGLGVEVKKTDFMSFVIEGRYTQYDDETLFDGRGLLVDAEPSEIKVLGELRFKLLTGNY